MLPQVHNEGVIKLFNLHLYTVLTCILSTVYTKCLSSDNPNMYCPKLFGNIAGIIEPRSFTSTNILIQVAKRQCLTEEIRKWHHSETWYKIHCMIDVTKRVERKHDYKSNTSYLS